MFWRNDVINVKYPLWFHFSKFLYFEEFMIIILMFIILFCLFD